MSTGTTKAAKSAEKAKALAAELREVKKLERDAEKAVKQAGAALEKLRIKSAKIAVKLAALMPTDGPAAPV